MTVFSLHPLRHLYAHSVRKIRGRIMHAVQYTAPPRRHDRAEHAMTRRMRY
jgi:hypothetical protein